MNSYMRNTLDWKILIERANLKKGYECFTYKIDNIENEPKIIIHHINKDGFYSLMMTAPATDFRNHNYKSDFIHYVKYGVW